MMTSDSIHETTSSTIEVLHSPSGPMGVGTLTNGETVTLETGGPTDFSYALTSNNGTVAAHKTLTVDGSVSAGPAVPGRMSDVHST